MVMTSVSFDINHTCRRVSLNTSLPDTCITYYKCTMIWTRRHIPLMKQLLFQHYM